MNTARLDLSDPALKEAIANVRSDTVAANYCLFGYEGKAKIVLKDSGEAPIGDVIAKMDDAEVSYALLRVSGGRDQESKTVKFVIVVYVGPSVGASSEAPIAVAFAQRQRPARASSLRRVRLTSPQAAWPRVASARTRATSRS